MPKWRIRVGTASEFPSTAPIGIASPPVNPLVSTIQMSCGHAEFAVNIHKHPSGSSHEYSASVLLRTGQYWPAPPAAPPGYVLEELARWEFSSANEADPWVEVEGFIAVQSHNAAASGCIGFGVLLGHDASIAALHRPNGWGSTASIRLGTPARSPIPSIPAAVVVAFRGSRMTRCAVPKIPPAGVASNSWRSSWSEREHAEAIEAVRAAIELGEVYQVNLVNHRWASLSGNGAACSAAWALTRLGSAYSGSIVGPGWSVHCASPELALRLRAGVVTTEPIKGTVAIAQGGAPALRASLKDRAEHVMIVDLERNDLARVAEVGSVSVTDFYLVREWAGLAHAHSSVSATIGAGVGLSELLRAVLPGGSVTGAPKSSALRLIHQLEPVGRGPAMGAMGWVGLDGSAELALTIRTIACDERAQRVHVWAGGGVTWGSTPDGEIAEAQAKAAPLIAALA